MKIMNVAIITIFTVPNYGSVLQAFATQRVIENLGHTCSIINYQCSNQAAGRQLTLKRLIGKMVYATGILPGFRKERRLSLFRKKWLKLTKPYLSQTDLMNEDWSKYDVLVCGSDQIWNPRFTNGDVSFLLSFANGDAKKVSIASSFAQEELPEEFVMPFRHYLNQFQAISVRESNGINIINQQLGIQKDVFLCPDPTLLLSKDEWLKELPSPNLKKKGKYILYYMWAYAFEPRPYIYDVLNHFNEKIGGDVVAVEGFSKQEGVAKMINGDNLRVEEIIRAFSNADLVITSSFHGTAFALNFGIPLISIVPDNSGDDRQSSLLKSVGAQSSIVRVGDDVDLIDPYYDASLVQKKLHDMKLESLSWITDNITA